MRNWKGSFHMTFFLRQIIFAGLLLTATNSSADSDHSISIIDLTSYVKEDNLLVDCEVKYHVEKRVREALNNGIEMTFVLEMVLRKKQDLLIDPTLGRYIHEFRIKYHALSKQYVMLEKGSHVERSFSDLYSAFYYQRNLHNALLANKKDLNLDEELYISARAKLVSEKLPLPLRIKSYLSKDWRPSSGWTIWPI